MKKLLIITLFFCGCTVITPLQRSRFITVSNLIDSGQFEEAKEVIEGMINDQETGRWARTWYLRGVLCQTAYQKGVETNSRKLKELYPNQLYTAYRSYERARSIDRGGRLERQLAPRYVLLANTFQGLGENHFNKREYEDALKAFEQALGIIENPILSVQKDTSLIFNAAISAYEGKKWDSAIKHLATLHKYRYSTNATHLLFDTHLQIGDTLAAEKTLKEGIKNYKDDEDLVLLLVDMLYESNQADKAIEEIDKVIARNPQNAKFQYTKGLIYQKTSQFDEAIEQYKKAVISAPDNIMIYVNIATCYYNKGVEIDENTRALTNMAMVQKERSRSEAAFNSATEWLGKANDKGTTDREVLSRLFDLYRALRLTDMADEIEKQLD